MVRGVPITTQRATAGRTEGQNQQRGDEMDRSEARQWLRDHGIQPRTAERMLTGAVDRGSSSKIPGDYGRVPEVFVTYDGRIFNVYET